MITIRTWNEVLGYSEKYYAVVGSNLIRICDGKIIREV